MTDTNLSRIAGTKKRQKQGEAFLFGTEEPGKIEEFEKLLEEQLSTSDSITEAVNKMVVAALTTEFGQDILSHGKARNMISTLSSGILSDSELRKQSLIIIDRFAKTGKLNA